MKVHHLKTWPEYFEAIIRGIKPFEFRLNDRDYQVGDFLDLEEYDPEKEDYTGRECGAFVTYMLTKDQFPILGGYVVMGLELRGVRQ